MCLRVLAPKLRQFGEIVVGVVRHNASATRRGLGFKCWRNYHTTRLGCGQLRLVLRVVEETQRVVLRSVERREPMYFKVGVANKTPA